MFPVLSCLFCFCIIHLRSVVGVRIFTNIQPTRVSTQNVPFKPEVISKTCLLKPQRGPCRSGITMYYYDANNVTCSTFEWGGCQGNGNRFDSEEECLDKCLSKRGAANARPKWCSLTFDYGYCFGASERYYFDNLWKICKKTIYSGCGGNKNNFFYKDQCESICLFRTGVIARKEAGKEETTTDGLAKNPNDNTTAIASVDKTK